MTTLTIHNSVSNGSFETDLSGWTAGGTAARSGTKYKYGTESVYIEASDQDSYGSLIQAVPTTIDHYYYFSCWGTAGGSDTGTEYSAYIHFGNDNQLFSNGSSLIRYSNIHKATATSTNLSLGVSPKDETSMGDRYAYFDGVIVIDLTECFGNGKEPTLPAMNDLIDPMGGWWEPSEDRIYDSTSTAWANLCGNGNFKNGTSGWIELTGGEGVTFTRVSLPKAYTSHTCPAIYESHGMELYNGNGTNQARLLYQFASHSTSHTFYVTCKAVSENEESLAASGISKIQISDNGYTGASSNAPFRGTPARLSFLTTGLPASNHYIELRVEDVDGGNLANAYGIFDGVIIYNLNDIWGTVQPGILGMDAMVEALGGFPYGEIPEAPTVTASSTVIHQVDISWNTPTSEGTIDYYNVQIYAGALWVTVGTTVATVHSFSYSSMTPGIQRQFRVAAHSSFGMGLYGGADATPIDYPGAPTINSFVFDPLSKKFTASYTTASTSWSQVTSITIKLIKVSDGVEKYSYTETGSIPDSTPRTYTPALAISALDANTLYEVQVTETNIGGTGPAGTLQGTSPVVSAPDLSLVPYVATNLSGITVARILTYPSGGASSATIYEVNYYRRLDNNTPTEADLVKTTTEPTTNWYDNNNSTGLSPGTRYYYRAKGYSASWTAWSSFGTPNSVVAPGKPSVPLGIDSRLNTANSRDIYVTWLSPDTWGYTEGKSYTLERATDPSGTWTVIADNISSSLNSYTDTTSKSWSVKYYYRICAVNSLGSGDYATDTIGTLTPAGPLPPLKIGASIEKYRNTPFVRIEWLERLQTSDEYAQTDYTIERKIAGESDFTIIHTNNYWDLSFYDPYFTQGVLHTYRISRCGGYTLGSYVEISITPTTAPRTAATVTPGTKGFIIHGVMFPVSDDGKPQIQIHIVTPPTDYNTAGIAHTYFQWAKEGEDFVTFSSPSGWHGTGFEAIDKDTDYNTTYKLRVYTANSSGQTLHTSNVVYITTYAPTGESFSNLYGNPYYLSGFYNSTAQSGSLLPVPDSTKTVDDLGYVGPTTNGNKLALKLPYDSVTPDNYVASLGAFKFVPFSYKSVYNLTTGTARYYCLVTKGARNNLSTAIPKIHIAVNTGTSTLFTVLTVTAIVNNLVLNNYDVAAGIFSDEDLYSSGKYKDFQGQFKFIYINEGYCNGDATKFYETALIDMSEVFGGNGADIDDAMALAKTGIWNDADNHPITISSITTAMKAMISDNEPSNSLWFTPSITAYKPIFSIPQPVFTTLNSTDFYITTCQDIIVANGATYLSYGGMDKSGCSPVTGYIFEYRAWNESDYVSVDVPLTSINSTTGLGKVTISDLEPSTKYYIRYRYTNEAGETSDPSDTTTILTPPKPRKVTSVMAQRKYDGKPYLRILWKKPLVVDSDEEPTGYAISINTNKNSLTTFRYDIGPDPDEVSTIKIDGVDWYYREYTSTSTDFPIAAESKYYYRVFATNSWGDGKPSDLSNITTTTRPDAPSNAFAQFERGVKTNNYPVIVWSMPESDGGAGTEYGNEQEFTGYVLKLSKATAANVVTDSATIYINTPITSYDTKNYGDDSFAMNPYDSIHISVAAFTNYTGNGSFATPGDFYGPVSVTFATVVEYLRFRGQVDTPGQIKLEFSQKESYEQPQDDDGNDMYWVVASGTTVGDTPGEVVFNDIPAGDTLQNIKNYFDQGYIYAVSSIDSDWSKEATNGKRGWPIFVNASVPLRQFPNTYGETYTIMGTDILGDYLDVVVVMYPFRGVKDTDNEDDLYDIYTSYIGTDDEEGLQGLNTLMITTDYTTDIYFQDADTLVLLNSGTAAAADGGKGVFQWRIDSAIVESNQYSNENVPQKSKVFEIWVDGGASLDAIAGLAATTLEDKINTYFTEQSPYKELYIRPDGVMPFTVTTSYYTDEDDVNHLYVNIKCIAEQVENQISSRTKYISNMYTSTKANTYLVKENTYELRSYEDMYGRNKPGSTTVNSTYVKRSYGFKFDLDYITSYQEDEKAELSLTPIPGTSSANTIGIDAQGTTRTINIDGIRVDNSNVWVFHAPYEYQVTSYANNNNKVEEAGVIYTGTSNWGWCKFMKAIMGTFQFVDGPYRLIMMSIPSSATMQYVLDRNSKYQYIDGTYIIKAGYEDMCYVMVDQFTFTKTEKMYNAIEYKLVLKRVLPLGSSA